MDQVSPYRIDATTLRDASEGVIEPSERLIDFIYHRIELVLGRESPDKGEAASDAFMQIIEAVRRGRFDPERHGKPTAWVAKIAVRMAIDYLRSATRYRARHESYDMGPEPTDLTWIDPDVRIERYQEAALVRAYLDDLDEKDRAIIVLRYYDDLSQELIAEIFDIPVGTVKSRLNRAESRLRNAIAKPQRRRV